MERNTAGAPKHFLRAPVCAFPPPGDLLLVLLLVFGSLSCGDDPAGPDQDGAATLSFMLGDSTSFSFTGTGPWPPSGSGVIARMDGAGKVLQVGGFRQTAGKAPEAAGPERRFDFLFLEIRDTAAIAPGSYTPSDVRFCRDLAISRPDSLAHTWSAGSLTIASVTQERVAGTFSLTARRLLDSAQVTFLEGRFDAPRGAPLLEITVTDSGDEGGSIQVLADTGTTPGYYWIGGPAYAVGVERSGVPGSLVWGVVTAFGDSIQSGVKHAQVPPGASVVAAAETVLTRGVAYRVTVTRIGGAFGWKVFTP